jgi:lysophospholipase L1-like esterase
MKHRILAALTAVALGATALLGTSSAAFADEPAGAEYVAFGDSVAAGTGLKPYVDEECLRSDKAYPSLLAAGYGSFASYACAGATASDVFHMDPNRPPSQVARAVAVGDLGPGTQVVTITAGINDVGWQELLLLCATSDVTTCQEAIAAAAGALQGMAVSLAGAVGAVQAATLGNATVLVTGYPLVFGTQVNGACSIGVVKGSLVNGPVKVTAEQRDLVNGGVAVLNQVIAAAAGAAGAGYVDLTTGFGNRGLCGSGGSWISGLIPGVPVSDRGFHPTTPGQQGIAQIIAAFAG